MKIQHPELVHAASLEQAESLQARIRDMVRIEPLVRQPHRIVGCDVAYSPDGEWGFATAVAVNLETLIEIEHPTSHATASFPYVSGLVAFRELPILIAALQKLTRIPDVIVVEGHGIAHPQCAGLASHLGVALEIPTIGCAKSPLSGDWIQPPDEKGAWTEIRVSREMVGAVLRSRAGSQPIFVSPGHMIDIKSSLSLVYRMCSKQCLPEPLARAHAISVKERDRHARQHQPI